MNYNQQQPPYYNYQQRIQGPPQPPWQPQPAPGWSDPRLQGVQQPPPPPPPFNPQFNQGNHGPPAGQPGTFPPYGPTSPPQNLGPQQYGTTQWGVRYNQTPQAQQAQNQPPNQYHQNAQQYLRPEQKPALPPRPTSGQAQPTQQFTPEYTYSQPENSNQYRPHGSWNMPHMQPHDPKAPTPPPRPVGYAAPSQFTSGGPQQEYSHHPPTHTYEPQTQNQSGTSQQEQYSHHSATHSYEPQAQVQAQSQPGWQQPYQHHSPATVTPGWDQPQQHTNEPATPIKDEGRRYTLPSHPLAGSLGASATESPQRPHPQRASISSTSGVKTCATALGDHGRNPSDWQLYNPVEHHDETEIDDERTPTIKQKSSFNASPEPFNARMHQTNVQTHFSEPDFPSQPQPLSPQPRPQSQHMSHSQIAEHGDIQPPITGYSNPSQTQAQPIHPPTPHVSRPSTVSSMSGIVRNDTIDNVIQAWYTPLMVDSSIQTSLPPSRLISPVGPQTHNMQTQTDFPPQVETRIETRVETKEIEMDPYEDIQNEYKATLKRFAGMLRQEAKAEGDEEKFQIFQGFVIRELRLRGVLYGVEATPQERTRNEHPDQSVEQRNNTQRGPDAFHPTSQSGSNDAQRAITDMNTQESSQLPKLNVQQSSPPISRDESYVVVNANDEDEYSPGGRPFVSSRAKTPVHIDSIVVPSNHSSKAMSSPPTHGFGNMSPSLNAPMTLDDYVMPERPSSTKNTAVSTDSSRDLHTTNSNPLTPLVSAALTGPINFQPERAPYQPFRYGEGPQMPIPEVRVHAPTDSYTMLRQNQAAGSGRELISDPPPANLDSIPDRSHSATPGGRREHEEAFIGLIRAKSQAIRKKQKTSGTSRSESPAILRAGTPLPRASTAPPPESPLVKSVRSLRALIPGSVPPSYDSKSPPPPKLEPIVSALKRIVDDFGFIHQRVLSWDKANRQVRGKQESERQERQSENESHIDQLFNDNEIGYADVAVLEKNFQLEEAGKKYKEDQDELDSFTKGVYQSVVEKVEDEITELTRLYSNAIDILDLESISGAKQTQALTSESSDSSKISNRVSVCIVMEVLHEIHDKLEVRHLKIAEANFERESRRKRLELSILYTNDDRPGIKRLEAEFAKAQKLQVLEESRKKAERITKLLDSFDRAVVRGLAEDQDVVDEVMFKVKSVHDLLLNANPADAETYDLLYGPEGIRDLLLETSTTIDYLLDDSTSLVKLLNMADVASNNADFALYIAEAKLADESPEKFEKLKREKNAEDRNIGEELTTRLNGMAMTPGDIKRLIRELRDKIGDDSGHQERISKALEAAKARNATAGG